MKYREFLKTKFPTGININRSKINDVLFDHQKDAAVFSPFVGVGSEGYCSLNFDRKFVGCELKSSYL